VRKAKDMTVCFPFQQKGWVGLCFAFSVVAQATSVVAALAQEPVATVQDSTARQLSIEEALHLGQNNLPQLVMAWAEQKVVESGKTGAALWFSQNPLFTAMLGKRTETTQDPTAKGFQYQVHVEQAFEIAGPRFARLAAWAAKVDVAEAQTELAHVETRALLQTAYMQAALSEQRVVVAQNREALANQFLASAATRLQLGATGALEVNLAQIEKGRVQADRVQAQIDASNRHTLLKVLCGIEHGTQLSLSTPHLLLPQFAKPITDLEELIALANANRADLRALDKQKAALAEESGRLRREAFPNLLLAFDYQRDLPGQVFVGGTVGLSLPVWNRNQGPLAQVAAQERKRQAEERLLRNRIVGEVAQAHARVVLLRSQVETFRKDVLPPSENNIDLLQRGWQAGKFDLFRVIAASRELADTRLRGLSLLEELWSAALELERAVGVVLIERGLR
jgi:cobalt-zinc-cadmium efflux system outer membrane protein